MAMLAETMNGGFLRSKSSEGRLRLLLLSVILMLLLPQVTCQRVQEPEMYSLTQDPDIDYLFTNDYVRVFSGAFLDCMFQVENGTKEYHTCASFDHDARLCRCQFLSQVNEACRELGQADGTYWYLEEELRFCSSSGSADVSQARNDTAIDNSTDDSEDDVGSTKRERIDNDNTADGPDFASEDDHKVIKRERVEDDNTTDGSNPAAEGDQSIKQERVDDDPILPHYSYRSTHAHTNHHSEITTRVSPSHSKYSNLSAINFEEYYNGKTKRPSAMTVDCDLMQALKANGIGRLESVTADQHLIMYNTTITISGPTTTSTSVLEVMKVVEGEAPRVNKRSDITESTSHMEEESAAGPYPVVSLECTVLTVAVLLALVLV